MTRGQFQLFDDLLPDEYAALKADIELRGVLVPVERDEHGALLDGHHRVRICEELGIDYPSVTRAGLTEAGKRAHVRAINLLRRHLSSEQKRRVIADQLIETPQKSDREIARLLGVTHPTVADVRRELIASGKIFQIAEREVTRGDATFTQRPKTIVAPTQRAAQRMVDLFERGSVNTQQLSDGWQSVRDVNRVAKQTAHQERIAALAAPDALPTGPFSILYADPPWRYEHVETANRAIENQYPTMSLEEIMALDVDAIAADDSLLFLWATNPKLDEAIEVIRAWGFTYRTNLVWVKDQIGMGYYARQQHELLLVARRGNFPTPVESARPASVIHAPRTRHSAKPHEVYALIEAMYPGVSRVELFSRSAREGWHAWGLEAGGAA